MAHYSQYTTLQVSLQEGILIITLNRPEVLNALNRMVLTELGSVFTEIEKDAAVRGIIITGTGHKAFAAGADISEIHALTQAEALEFSRYGQAVFNQIENCSRPVIAAVNGFALGGGCELAMACHLRVAAENARFGQPEVNLGLIAGYGGTQRLPRLIGRTKALEYLLTADMISASEALELRLVNHVVTQEELIEKCQEILTKISTKSPLAIAETIQAVNKAGLSEGFEKEAQSFAQVTASSDGKEGTQAFLEKRKPVFTGK
jgi:enoyl-CoA hydratase